MTRLLQVTDELRDLHAELIKLEADVAAHPTEDALLIDLYSLKKRQNRLEAEFRELADQKSLDVVSYRLAPDQHRPIPLRAMTRTLDRFQAAIATIFHARKVGPQDRARIPADVYSQAGMDFAYSFAGSLGIVLTVSNERMLLDHSDLDFAIADFFAAANAQTREEVIAIAHRLGVSTVRRVYEWSSAHADYDIAADINVLRSNASRTRLQVAPPTLQRLKEIIEETSDVADDPFTFTGILRGLDTTDRTFHFEVADTPHIHGDWAEDFNYSPTYVLDVVYEADLVKRTKVHYAIEKEETVWVLKRLTRKADPGD